VSFTHRHLSSGTWSAENLSTFHGSSFRLFLIIEIDFLRRDVSAVHNAAQRKDMFRTPGFDSASDSFSAQLRLHLMLRHQTTLGILLAAVV
jgi:hypothetical protein